MTGFLDRMFGRNRDNSSASKAKERLQLVLFHDRINLPPEHLQAMKREIIAVISKYVHVAEGDVDIALEQRDRGDSLLRAEIPFSKVGDLEDDGMTQPNPVANMSDDTEGEDRTNPNLRIDDDDDDEKSSDGT